MRQPFDPYHKWLGIPPEEQPPSYYRLLGIRDFEADHDVIEAAADQRMAHLRKYQTSRHADLSQRLLNEVSTARICLLNPSKQAAYDEQLKVAMPADSTAPRPSEPAFPIVDEEWSPRITRRKALGLGRRKPSRNVGTIIGVVLAVGLLIVALVAWQIASREGPSGAKPPVRQPKPVQKAADTLLPTAPTDRHLPAKIAAPAKPPTGPSSGHDAISPSKPRPSPDSPHDQITPTFAGKTKAVLKVDLQSGDSSAATPGTGGRPAAATLRSVDGQELRRVAVPSAAEQEAAMKLAGDLYRSEFAQAKTPQARNALATKLLDQAKQQATGEAAGTFVLLRLARDLAAQAGDGATAFQTIDVLAERFEIDGVNMKADVLVELVKKARAPLDHLSIAQQAADLMDEAAATGNFAQAAQLGKLAAAEGAKAHDRDIVLQARGRLKEIQGAIKLSEEFEAARTKLTDQPDDTDANTTAGSYYCFLRNDWEKGLPHLAKGRDPTLKALAQRELQESPKDAVERVKLADAWWDLAQKTDAKRRETLLLHAGSWYGKAQPTLPAGMVKLKVEKRLDEIEKLDRKSTVLASPGL